MLSIIFNKTLLFVKKKIQERQFNKGHEPLLI